MGWRLRRVLKAGPFRGTLSKSGIGWSVGIPGFRVGVSAIGQKYISVGFPGLGIYWIKYFGPRRGLPSVPPQQQPPPLVGIPPTSHAASKDPPWWKRAP